MCLYFGIHLLSFSLFSVIQHFLNMFFAKFNHWLIRSSHLQLRSIPGDGFRFRGDSGRATNSYHQRRHSTMNCQPTISSLRNILQAYVQVHTGRVNSRRRSTSHLQFPRFSHVRPNIVRFSSSQYVQGERETTVSCTVNLHKSIAFCLSLEFLNLLLSLFFDSFFFLFFCASLKLFHFHFEHIHDVTNRDHYFIYCKCIQISIHLIFNLLSI